MAAIIDEIVVALELLLKQAIAQPELGELRMTNLGELERFEEGYWTKINNGNA